jgi:capsular polysaccharide biosynthesis protein
VIDPGWRVEEPDPDDDPAQGSPLPTLASLDFLRGALRRRWPVWVIAALLGLLASIAFNHAVPPKSSASVTVLLAHDPQQDPTRAMATDVSLLGTRAVAQQVIDRLHIKMSPDDFLKSVTAHAATDQVLVVNATGPDDAAAVARAQALAETFLSFRAGQLNDQTDVLVKGYDERVAALQAQVSTLTQHIDELSKPGAQDQSALSDAINQRAQLTQQIDGLQTTIQDATLRNTSVVAVSHIIDPASAVPQSHKRRAVLSAVTGLIGGAALGITLVLFLALTSGRVRRREEVAQALDAPVRLSVGRLRPRLPLRLLPRRRGPTTPRGRAGRHLEAVAHALESQTRINGGRPAHLALVSVDSVTDTTVAAAELVARALARGSRVFAVDLSRDGKLAKRVDQAVARRWTGEPRAATAVVYRPEGDPTLAQGPLNEQSRDSRALQADKPSQDAWDAAEYVIALAEVDPASGAPNLGSWSEDAVLFVTAGRSSGERLRTAAELVRGAGLRLRFGILLRTDRTDDSLGMPDPEASSRILRGGAR